MTILIILGAIGGSIQVSGRTIDGREGQTQGDITVNGRIGEFDNETPGPDPEDINSWINVTIPTTALFYTTEDSSHEEITSPGYSVSNNSAKGVTTTVSGVEDAEKMDEVDLLTIKDVDNATEKDIELFRNGQATVTESELFELDTKQIGGFIFSGKASPVNSAEESNPKFKLVLSFATVVDTTD